MKGQHTHLLVDILLVLLVAMGLSAPASAALHTLWARHAKCGQACSVWARHA